MKGIYLVMTLLVVLLSCNTTEDKLIDNSGEPRACTTANDCLVKDTGSCCGYNPGCINKNFEPNLETIKRECQEKSIAGACGFREVTGCDCINNTCINVY